MSLPIGEVSRLSGLSPDTLRGIGFGLEQVRDLLTAKSSTHTVRARIDAARASLDRFGALLTEKEMELQKARELLGAWRAELDSGEPWPDTPLPGYLAARAP